jgi:glyoxylase-like metal-dependent hydrolase (beta-lactamase superfamily II)
MTITSVTVGPFVENCYLVVDDATRRAVLVDPGDEPERIAALVRQSGATLEAIWLTHGHIDHIAAVAAIKRIWDVPVHLHPDDLPLYDHVTEIGRMYGLSVEAQPAPDHTIADGERLSLGSLEFTAMHTPGHAPGHVIFIGEGLVLGGDLLFAGSIGRTDLPLSDPARMRESLERILTLDDAMIVHPGHGGSTTIGTERRSNPFLTGIALPARR